jgi:hemoglobin
MTHELEESLPASTPYERLGGEHRVRELTQRFYHLMDCEEAYQELRAVHGPDLSHAQERLFWFLSGWLGGPSLYQEQVGHPMLRARHLPFKIGILERNQWLLCMHQAMSELGVEEDLKDQLAQSFFKTADWMRNT